MSVIIYKIQLEQIASYAKIIEYKCILIEKEIFKSNPYPECLSISEEKCISVVTFFVNTPFPW